MPETWESEEYERGYGSGPHGTREVNLCSIRFNPVVSLLAAAALWGFVLYAVLDENSDTVFGEWQSWVTKTFTWLYIASQDYWLVFLFPLCYYYGDMKLGKDDEEPEYSDLTYLAMIWCAGVAIGLIFYGASEPLFHMQDATNKYNNNGYFNDNEKAMSGLHLTLFHWGFLAWVVYAITALTMGFLSYRKGLPLCFRTCMAPLFGKATWGWMGDLLDVLTIVTIVAGLCTSLGLGAKQIVGGLQRLEWLESTLTEDELTSTAGWVIGVITLCATASVVAGLDFGIKTVSYIAFMMGNFLMVVVFCLDEPWYLLNVLVQTVGYHLGNFVEVAFDTDAFAQLSIGNGQPNDGKGADPSWMDWWTIFYWGWWIAWAPFVGTFMARISRGRTIKQVVTYSLTLPCLYSLLWFGIFGGAAIRMHRRALWLEDIGTQVFGDASYFLHTSPTFRPSGAGNCYDVPTSLPGVAYRDYSVNPYVTPVCAFSGSDSEGYWFDLMGQYYGMGPFLTFVSVVTTILYFVTSSDSGSLVVDLIAANGREAHVVQRVFWALTEGAVAIACVASGGFSSLTALRAISIVMGLPFTLVLMMMVTSLWRALKIEAGDLPPRGERSDWRMALYEGVFDVPEVILSLGKAKMPSGKRIVDFLLAAFLPPVALWRSMRGLAKYEKVPTGASVHWVLSFMCGLFFKAFIVLHIVSAVFQGQAGWDVSGKAMWCMAWIAYLCMASVIALGRHQIRRLYGIEGSGIEDMCAAIFLYPQVLCQLMVQVENPPPPTNWWWQVKQKKEKDLENITQVGKAVDTEVAI